MARPVPMPPPGFDDLPADDKVSYVQSLWDRVAADEGKIPVPEWHRAELRRRLQKREEQTEEARDWDEVWSDLRRDLNLNPEEGRFGLGSLQVRTTISAVRS